MFVSGRRSGTGPGTRFLHRQNDLLAALDAFSRSYRLKGERGLRTRFNHCHDCVEKIGRVMPPPDFFDWGQCSVCAVTRLVCDPWLADLCLALGVGPGRDNGAGIPRLRQRYPHKPSLRLSEALACVSRHLSPFCPDSRG